MVGSSARAALVVCYFSSGDGKLVKALPTRTDRLFFYSYARLCQINAGAIGDVRTIHITSRDPAPPPVAYLQNSGGIFMDMTSHDFDMARFLVSAGVREFPP